MALIGVSVAAGSTAAGGLLADSVPRTGSGAAVGMNQMAGDLGYLTAPTALGYVAQGSFELAYLLGALPAALVLVVALRLPGRRARAAPSRPEEIEPAEPVA
jgi:MFS family permease